MDPSTPDFFAEHTPEEDAIYEMLQAKYAPQLLDQKDTLRTPIHPGLDPFDGVFDSDSETPGSARTNLLSNLFLPTPESSPTAAAAATPPLAQLPKFNDQMFETHMLPLLRSYGLVEPKLTQCCAAVSAMALLEVQRFTCALHEALSIPQSAARDQKTTALINRDLFSEHSPPTSPAAEFLVRTNMRHLEDQQIQDQQLKLVRRTSELREERQHLDIEAAQLESKNHHLLQQEALHKRAAASAELEKQAELAELREQLLKLTNQHDLATREVSELRGALLRTRESCENEIEQTKQQDHLRENAVFELAVADSKVEEFTRLTAGLNERLESALKEAAQAAQWRQELAAAKHELDDLKASSENPGAVIGKFEQLLARLNNEQRLVKELREANEAMTEKRDTLQVKLHACKQLIRRYAINPDTND